ncbi:D-alanine--poly(phosphoribitol) ligase subunit DltA [Caproicibacter fermentans]|uniref:D-alanine--poly(Phosphoribitol) ligase subunit DltA n=1 Tax=Caproicibacter fermentans TaxID=2576756 RepID=A0A7G8TF59_9FIRM|nr:D-alanine--poly(phosphoribitol) ligase subunit DltA [Caproicibacter fermentans]QNK42250.1 D-alanine--poly(phosphoribitol) ligase subunit DltA [Caproicibacter fermentans]
MWLLNQLKGYSTFDNTAIIYRDNNISYRDLWERSEQLACFINNEAKTNNPIVIYGNKEIDITVVMIACLKAGKAYVPVDTIFPKERLLRITDMTETELVFNFSDTDIVSDDFKTVNATWLATICSKYRNRVISSDNWVKPEDNCYILFTSGSTGLPKGVQIKRKNIENFVSWFQEYCKIDGDDHVVLNQISYSFDVSVISLYVYLAMGKTLFNIDKAMLEDIRILFSYLRKSEISVWISTPTFLEICSFDASFNADMLPKLKKVILAGEVLTKNLVNTLNGKFNRLEIINGYGPTEGTVLLTACRITQSMLDDKKDLPIGYLLPNSVYRLVDDNGEEVKDGGTGELIVVSDSISEGYYKNPEQTHQSFFKTKSGQMGYKTGDMAFVQDKLFYYVGRFDFQIKLNGFRIELGDISNNLNKINFVSNSVVLPVIRNGRINSLTAFVTLNGRTEASNIKIGIKIKQELKNLIPSYMIPKKIVILDQFPLNSNGKIDRKKLMENI